MFAGHLGAGLILKRAGRNVGLGSIFFATMLLDFVLWALVLSGTESVRVPPDFHRGSDLAFDFPYSHGLFASLGWSGAAFALGWWSRRLTAHRLRFAFVIALAVFSHFVLDWAVHRPELPILGRDSAKLGLGLWQQLPLAWTIEVVLGAVGLWVYLKVAGLTPGRRAALVGVMIFVMAMTIVGQAATGPPPKPAAMASTSLAAIALLVVFGWWIERLPRKAVR